MRPESNPALSAVSPEQLMKMTREGILLGPRHARGIPGSAQRSLASVGRDREVSPSGLLAELAEQAILTRDRFQVARQLLSLAGEGDLISIQREGEPELS